MPPLSAPYLRRPYVPQIYESPNLVRIADLPLAAANLVAANAMRSGDRTAYLWNQIGNTLGGAAREERLNREQAPQRAFEQQQRDFQTRQMTRADQQYEAGQRKAQSDAEKAALLQELIRANGGQRVPKDVLLQKFGPDEAAHIDKVFDELFKQPEKKTREVKTRNADGSETTQIVEDVPGQTFSSAPPIEKPKYTAPMRMANGTYQQFEEGKIPPDAKFYVDPKAPKDERLVQVMDASGQPIWVRESEAVGRPATQAARAVTGQERKVLGFFQRMLEAERNARAVEDKIGLRDFAAEHAPTEWLENWMHSKEGQNYVQAQRTFTEGRLRKESGAAIANSEYDKDKTTNFRRPNDTPESIAQKRASRLTTLRGAANEAGRALEEFYGTGTTIDSLLSEFDVGKSSPKPELKGLGVNVAPPKSGEITLSADGLTVNTPDGPFKFPSKAAADGFMKTLRGKQ